MGGVGHGRRGAAPAPPKHSLAHISRREMANTPPPGPGGISAVHAAHEQNPLCHPPPVGYVSRPPRPLTKGMAGPNISPSNTLK